MIVPTRRHPKNALVTGSTSGIGAALSELLAADGYDLVLVARSREDLECQAFDLARKYGACVVPVAIDLSTHDAVDSIVGRVREFGMRIDVLINNAGFNECGPFVETDLANELRIIEAQAAATVKMCKAFAPAMVERGSGRIMNLGSTGAFAPVPLDSVYCAAKAFIRSFSEALGAELSGSGVSVTVLCPGATRTRFAARAGVEDTVLFTYATMSAQRVAEVGYRAMSRGKRVVVPGWTNRLMVGVVGFMPRYIRERLGKFLWRKSRRARRTGDSGEPFSSAGSPST